MPEETSIIVTSDPRGVGGVGSMRAAVVEAHKALGLSPVVVYPRQGRLERFDWRVHAASQDGLPTLSTGYLPSIEYLNPVVPAVVLRHHLRRGGVVQVVGGSHALSLIPILARVPFVSWVATPYSDEVESRAAADKPSLSVLLNKRLVGWNTLLERWTCRFPAKIFALSHYTERRLADITGLPVSAFEVLRQPVDTELFRPDGPRWAGIQGPYVISVGRVDDERKNMTGLVRAFARVAQRDRTVNLVLAGRWSPAGPVAQLVSALRLNERVLFLGELTPEELAPVYRGARAFAFASRQEGLGIVVLEAQASGVPPVIMRCGGGDELIEHGKTGWLVDQGDEDGLAEALLRVLRDKELGGRAGRAAREQVLATCSKERFRQQLGAVYREVYGTCCNTVL